MSAAAAAACVVVTRVLDPSQPGLAGATVVCGRLGQRNVDGDIRGIYTPVRDANDDSAANSQQIASFVQLCLLLRHHMVPHRVRQDGGNMRLAVGNAQYARKGSFRNLITRSTYSCGNDLDQFGFTLLLVFDRGFSEKALL